ncbi:hypothetical protein V8G54_004042 [Vigna mungo]|uniref:Uncharacterized protein n=1 Tax=Vigna mungo TaxID=3915 RepID=A0AAQ3PBY9_VIGMU
MTTLEITVVFAEGLNQPSYYFNRIRPFFTLTKLPAHLLYHYDGGGTGDHVFRVPLDPTFFSDKYSRLHLHLYNDRRFIGPTLLKWCLIPPSDIAFPPSHSFCYLIYRSKRRFQNPPHPEPFPSLPGLPLPIPFRHLSVCHWNSRHSASQNWQHHRNRKWTFQYGNRLLIFFLNNKNNENC